MSYSYFVRTLVQQLRFVSRTYKMKKFGFSSKPLRPNESNPPFSGPEFYNIYKEAHFLRNRENIKTILSKGYELRRMLKDVTPGEVVALDGMYICADLNLLVKKTGPNIEIKRHEFTANRLSGMVAAYTFSNRLQFDDIVSSEAESLGLKWNNEVTSTCRLYLSAVSGTEHFYEQFHYWPLICAIRKLQQKKITIEPVIKMAKIKNPQKISMAEDFMKNMKTVNKIWNKHFGGTSKSELLPFILVSPLWKIFQAYA